MFHHYVNDDTQRLIERRKAWQSLVHVCRRWRSIIFGSPRHLNLQLVCTERSPVKDALDIWPSLPPIIQSYSAFQIGSVDNIVAVLERSDRVCQIHLVNLQSSDLEMIFAAMQQPFPELTDLSLQFRCGAVPVVPESFLGGSAPRLQNLRLYGISSPGSPKLILSATHLVGLTLRDIPHSGYIPPDVMVTALSSLTSLQGLTLKFRSPRSCPDQATSASLDTLCPSRSQIFSVQGGHRIFGGPRGLHRCPSSQLLAHNLLQWYCIKHTTIYATHQSHVKVESTRKGLYYHFGWRRQPRLFITDIW